MITDFLNNNNFDIIENNNTLISILLYNTNTTTFKNNLLQKLETIKNIKHPKTKKLLNDRIYGLIQELDNFQDDKILNCIYFLDNSINTYLLKKKEINLLKEYNFKNYNIYFEDKFKVEYFLDLFTNLDFYDIIELSKNKLVHSKITLTKSKIINETPCKNTDELINIIKKISNNYLIVHGISTLLKKFQYKDTLIFNKKLNKIDILDEINKLKIKDNHKKLEIVFEYLEDESKLHLLIYGKIKKEIKEAVEAYRVKEMFCHKERLHILKKQLPKEYYNFPIHIIDKLDDGDIGDRLLKDYRGAIGIAYY